MILEELPAGVATSFCSPLENLTSVRKACIQHMDAGAASFFLDRAGERHSVNVNRQPEGSLRLSCDNTSLLLLTIEPIDAASSAFFDMFHLLVDVIVSKRFVEDSAELLLVHPASPAGTWLCSVLRGPDGWHATAAIVTSPPSIDVAYAISSNASQGEDLAASFEVFQRIAGRLLQRPTPLDSPVPLRVKVHHSERWFLRFPLGIYIRKRYPGFASHSSCQWIVTERSISSVGQTQRQIEGELADTVAFFSGARFILNTYRHHEQCGDAHQIAEAFSLLVEVLEVLSDINYSGRTMKAHWFLNPPQKQLAEIFLNPESRFIFADFEAGGGVWSLGDGAPHDERPNHGGEFDLEALRGRLSHIRLMRIFHCHSLFDPYVFKSNPLDDHTLGAQILATGAFFVEGSLTEEPVVDFVCSVLSFLLGREDVKFVLRMKMIVDLRDLRSLLRKINSLLTQSGFARVELEEMHDESD